jgi:predicted ABC-type transport system involved in lysophospholipase L1 biosynthesis ATPase subunit
LVVVTHDTALAGETGRVLHLHEGRLVAASA